MYVSKPFLYFAFFICLSISALDKSVFLMSIKNDKKCYAILKEKEHSTLDRILEMVNGTYKNNSITMDRN